MLLSMGAVFAFICWFLFLVPKNFTNKNYDRNLGLIHFINVVYWWLILRFFPMHFFSLAGIASSYS